MRLSMLLVGATALLQAPHIISAAPTATQERDLIDILDPIFSIIDTIPILGDLVSGKILKEIVSYLDLHPATSLAFPGLHNTLGRVSTANKSTTFTGEDYIRGLLSSIEGHSAFSTAFKALDADLQKNVTAFINGTAAKNVISKRGFVIPASPAAKRHFEKMEGVGLAERDRAWLNAKRQTSPVIYEDEAKQKSMAAYVAAEFENWGLTVSNTPSYTFVPTTVHGLQNLIKWAASNNKRVRAAGYRHTWSNMFSEQDEVFVSMLDLKTANAVPDPSSILPDNSNNANNEFKVIELADKDVPGSNGGKRLARLGAAVTNEEFRRWALRNGKWTLPLNVIMVEITVGGANAPICHGAGITHKTLSDLVRKIEYVDVNGVHQSVEDPEKLKAAAGSFGLLGVVTHVTIELDKMSYAVMNPTKEPVGLAIPPPKGFKVPKAIEKKYTDQEIESARQTFVKKAEKSYYSEWFWFPYQPQSWVNCWDPTDDPTGAIDYPTAPDLFLQWIQGWLGGVINDDPLFRLFPGHWQATILGSLAMFAMPPQLGIINTSIKTPVIDGLHFRRGVQNMRVRDMELQVPIPPLASDPSKPDWSVVQKAWWDAIAAVYEDENAPMRVALEMRIMSGSDIIMAPQLGNTFGTASIEVLTTMPAVAEGVWDPFVQEVADRWMKLQDGNGVRLNTRPHWAKEWDGMKVDGKPWKQYLKEVSYKDQIPKFITTLEAIGKDQGWTVDDLKNRFSCELLDYIFFDS